MIDKLFKEGVTLPPGKDKTIYIILALFLGGIGIHNFWAGATEKAKLQLIVGIICICLCLGFIPFIWSICDILHVKDAQ